MVIVYYGIRILGCGDYSGGGVVYMYDDHVVRLIIRLFVVSF